jgi:hypothetical protein
MRKVKHRGLASVNVDFLLNLIGYNLEHVPPQLNRGDSREVKDRRVYRH